MTDRPWQTDSALPETLADLRAAIPALDDRTYLNWGASGPSPRTVVSATEDALEYHEFESPRTAGMYGAAADIFDAARSTVADHLGATESEIALVQSTTMGINRVGSAIDWGPGDVVVTTDLEHVAGRLPWSRLRDRFGIEVRVLETDAGVIDLDVLEEALDGADLLCVSAVDWLYGRRHPVTEMVELAHEHDALALIDAVQVPGQLPIDVTEWGADFVAGAGHKWLLGPWGAGFLYVSSDVVEEVEPMHVGHRSVAEVDGGAYELSPDAARFELGTTSPAPYAGITRGIEAIESIGMDTIRERIRTLRDRFVSQVPPDRLRSPSAPHSGLVTIQVTDPERTVESLAETSITARSLPLPESVRFSFHAVNTEAEVDELVDTLDCL
ncbi:MAG: aminotransferase class V-fold PLP-dependent enzyme [Halodesulfurarchaeum sp.]